MTIQTKEGFLDVLSKKTPKIARFAKLAAVVGATFLTVFTAEANSGKQTDTGAERGNAASGEQGEYSPQRKFRQDFVRGMVNDFALGAANPLVEASMGGSADFAIVTPNGSKTTNGTERTTTAEKRPGGFKALGGSLSRWFRGDTAAADKAKAPEATKVATQTAGAPAKGIKVRERD